VSRSGSCKPDPDLEGVELLFHWKGGSDSFGTKMTLSLNGVDPSCINSDMFWACSTKHFVGQMSVGQMSVGQMAFDRMTWSHRKVLVGGQHSTASKSHLLKNVFIITKDPLLTSYVIISWYSPNCSKKTLMVFLTIAVLLSKIQ
jgi:hypothetical protein